MIKCCNQQVAMEYANDRQAHYGVSVFDGKYYVGSIPELDRAGVTVRRYSATSILDDPSESYSAYFGSMEEAETHATLRHKLWKAGNSRSRLSVFILETVLRDGDGRGASLQYSPNGVHGFASVSYHDNERQAIVAFLEIEHFKDRNPRLYRIVCHSEDLAS